MKKNVRSKRRVIAYVCAVLVFLTGVCVYAYPFLNRGVTARNIEQTLETFRYIRSVYNDAPDAPIEDSSGAVRQTESQKQAANMTAEQKQRYDKSDFDELKNAMQEYNEKIYEDHQAGLKDAWSYEEAEFDLRRYGVYDNVVAELRIPAMDCDLPLYLGATWNNMAWGAVQLGKTSMPIGGKNTNCVIAGHRGCTNGPYFLYIQNLQIGDKVYLDNLWETLTYKVCDIKVISPDDIPAIHIQEGKDMVTLITCHPYPYNYQRYAVYCERTANDPPAQNSGKSAVTTDPGTSQAATQPSNAQPVTEVIDETRTVTTEIEGDSTGFIRLENVLTVVVPIFVILLTIILFSLTSRRRLRRKRTKK